MNPDRMKELFVSFSDALGRLDESLREDIAKSSTIVDGTIQRFEFTFELAWKLLRLILLREGVEANTPRAALKEAYRTKLVRDGDGWIDMLEDRNKTSHLYDEAMSAAVYYKIKDSHFPLLRDFRDAAKTMLETVS
ncbi:MAG: Nucleotidyltransferase substrate binding protein like protein [Candidatus Omnitrophica bacterium ADurb.Bin277]|nr:MAG: Nucleotidyltransferase substrate binding protein like protein [Candidatus Omnitrophica bacterium ADurb.Bin277]